MDYAVVHLQDNVIGGLQTLDLDECGNQYRVSLYNKETGKHHHKRFDTLDAAGKVLCSWYRVSSVGIAVLRAERKFWRCNRMREKTVCAVCGCRDIEYLGKGQCFCPQCEGVREARGIVIQSPQERTRAAVYATGNRWAIENFSATY